MRFVLALPIILELVFFCGGVHSSLGKGEKVGTPNGFDRVLVLSLARNAERRASVEEQMDTLGWKNWQYVNGVDGNGIDYQDAAQEGKVVLRDECVAR